MISGESERGRRDAKLPLPLLENRAIVLGLTSIFAALAAGTTIAAFTASSDAASSPTVVDDNYLYDANIVGADALLENQSYNLGVDVNTLEADGNKLESAAE